MEKLKHIELFAGCGGMSLGLEAAGFELYFANELSPMAGETFSYNLLDENLEELAKKGKPSEKVLWIKSNYDKLNLKSRLRENPFKYEEGRYCDLNQQTDLNGKLLIGNINHLLDFLKKNKSIGEKLKEQNIDLISGGPPCQSFSLAGRREKDNHKNLLPLSFAQVAGLVKPKMVLLENVKGITSPFSLEGQKYYAWVEVAKAFCLEGFVPICMMVNSKFFGIPQNRPRFILLAIRKDIFHRVVEVVNDTENKDVLDSSLKFYQCVQKKKEALNEVDKSLLKLYDIEKVSGFFNGELFPCISTTKGSFITAEEAINDLPGISQRIGNTAASNYVIQLNALFNKKKIGRIELKNHETRKHNVSVQSRFRWFQILSKLNGLAPHALKLLSGQFENEGKLNAIFERVQGEEVLMKVGVNGERIVIKDRVNFINYIKSIQTKKHSQRALKASEPAPAQLTIPDDLCHYSPTELRTLTVREMARFQSFPDWFEFRSKITTGGNQRSFEVPQYTQVGNAVPPLLALRLGYLVKNILNKIKDGERKN